MNNKVKWIASILLVFLIVLSTNLIDRANFKKVNEAVTTIYQDRMVATNILMDMLIHLKDKELAVQSTSNAIYSKKNEAIHKALLDNIEAFKQTKLTNSEAIVFASLSQEIKTLVELEQGSIASKDQVLQHTANIIDKLHELQAIQIKEGKQQMVISNQAMETIDLFTKVEIIFLIIIAILLQLIIFSKTTKYNLTENASSNSN